MLRDLISNIAHALSLVPAARTADATGTGVNLAEYRAAEACAELGVPGITLSGTDYIGAVLEESDSSGSGYTAVADADMTNPSGNGSGEFYRFTSNANASSVKRTGYKGSKQYIRVNLNFEGTHGTATPCATRVTLGLPKSAPQTA